MKSKLRGIAPVKAEGVEIAFAKVKPVNEFNTEFVGALTFAQHLVLVQPEKLVEFQ